MRGAAKDLDLPAIRADGADGDIGGGAAVVVEGHHRRAQIGGPDVARAIKPALLAHAEQQRDRRMIELLLGQLGRQRDENAAAGAVVAAERGLRLIDDLAAGKLRLRAGAQRHGVHVGHEHDPRLVVHRAAAGQIDDEVAGLGRHGNAGVGVVEADRIIRHAAFPQRRGELAPDRGLLSGDALDGEKAHQAVSGGFGVDRHGESFDERSCEHPSSLLPLWEKRGADPKSAPEEGSLSADDRTLWHAVRCHFVRRHPERASPSSNSAQGERAKERCAIACTTPVRSLR